MSLIEARLRFPVYDLRAVRLAARRVMRARPQVLTPIVPTQSLSGKALAAVIAIMTLLASLTLGAVVLVRSSAGNWQSQVAREVTIQVRPVEGRDIETEVRRATLIARASQGVAQVRPYSRAESLRLLEPWLGGGLALDELPIPRLVVITLAPGAKADLHGLRQSLADQVAGASLDDHRAFLERMRQMTRLAVAGGFAVLALVLGATLLMVVFATRGAMASNRNIVEVLHFVGAKNRFIATQFQRHFLALGLKGALVGGGIAMLLFAGAHFLSTRTSEVPEGVAWLMGDLSLAPEGYAGIIGLVVLVAAVAALTSRWTVHRTLASLD